MSKPKRIREVYKQEMHCCGPLDDESTLTLSIEDGGAGPYLVLNATEWSIESQAEIDDLRGQLMAMLPTEDETDSQDRP